MYLTFDCGYENGYTEQILDTLKKHNAKACFFVTQTYIRDNVELVKRMKEEGHQVGNHTVTHPSMPGISVEKQKEELQTCADYMKEARATGWIRISDRQVVSTVKGYSNWQRIWGIRPSSGAWHI